MEDALPIIIIIITCTVKFAVGFMLICGAGLKFGGMVAATSTGGLIGVLVFTFLSDAIIAGWMKMKRFLGFNTQSTKPKKVFSKGTRKLVRIKSNYGLVGIAAITPILLSIPVGTFVAVKYYGHKKSRLIMVLSISVIFWSIVLSAFSSPICEHFAN